MSEKFDISNIAKLASLSLNDDEKQKLSSDLSVILEKPSLTHDEALSNAPKASDGKFIVPPSLE